MCSSGHSQNSGNYLERRRSEGIRAKRERKCWNYLLTRVCLIKYVGFKLHLPHDCAAAAAILRGSGSSVPAALTVCVPRRAASGGAHRGGTRDHSELTFDDVASGIYSQHYCCHRLLFLTHVLMDDVSRGSRRTPIAPCSSDIIKYTLSAILLCV